MAYINNYFDDGLSFNPNLNTQSDNNDIECLRCSETQIKPLRCKCCNEKISINDLFNHLKKKFGNGIKKVKSGDKDLCKIHLKALNSVASYLKPDAVIYGSNFTYDIDYMTNDATSIKIINRIEIKEQLANFNSSSLPVQSLLMHDYAVNNNSTMAVLINFDQFNV